MHAGKNTPEARIRQRAAFTLLHGLKCLTARLQLQLLVIVRLLFNICNALGTQLRHLAPAHGFS